LNHWSKEAVSGAKRRSLEQRGGNHWSKEAVITGAKSRSLEQRGGLLTLNTGITMDTRAAFVHFDTIDSVNSPMDIQMTGPILASDNLFGAFLVKTVLITACL
jgi:hypothetical protein